ncbi:hypothetical protein NP493_797g01000 [Ridgeia piscesae]|uniref:Uncharacterized protein n=1 Tax=Ridgeia piscesae TaxID=27915 RepID=A0AAD9KNG7_RIDPI|nr:hypothetical protein NP493_797g01000 [Ridgeia piscesae]
MLYGERESDESGVPVPVPFQIDSGSECCVLPRHEYVRVTGDRSLAKLRPVKTVIVTTTEHVRKRWVSRSRPIPKLAMDVYRDKKIAKNAQIEQYNKSAHHLNPLAPGDAIRMK